MPPTTPPAAPSRLPGPANPSPRRVGFLSVHTSPLEQPGTGDSGGMNVYISSLARELALTGVAVDVFTRAAGADLPPAVPLDDGITVHHVPAGPPRLAKSDLASHLCGFALGLAAHPVTPLLDLLHGHYWMSGWVGRHASRRLGMPLVQSFHTLARAKNDALAPGDFPESPLRLAAEERIVADADAIIAPTPAEARLLAGRYGASPHQIHVVEPGVDLTVFHPDGDRLTARQALGGGRIVLFAGRLQPLKGPDAAVRALAALDDFLPDDGVPTRLVIVGGPSGARGVRPADLRRLAGELGVADRVALLAPRGHDELAALYRAADVVVMPSRSESFGLVALEAQACGTPVVASAVGGLVDAVAPNGGTLVEGYDPRDYAAALSPYLTDARRRAAASQAAAHHARRFRWQTTAAGTLEVYRRVLTSGAQLQAVAAGCGSSGA